MALAKRNSKSNTPGWSADEINSKLGGNYSNQEIEKALAEFGSVSTDEELAIFQKMLPTPAKAEPVQQAQPRSQSSVSPAEAMNAATGTASNYSANLIGKVQSRVVEKLDQKFEPLVEKISDKIADQTFSTVMSGFARWNAQMADENLVIEGTTLGNYQLTGSPTEWLTLDTKALPAA